ncbi:MAG: hypothetical protein AAG110_08670 [Bacillus velezensis]
MFVIREWKNLITDLCSDKWKISGWFCLFILTILFLIKSARLEDLKGTISIADAMDQFFSIYTFTFPLSPLFLLFVSIGVLPFFSLFRTIRYRSRSELFLALIARLFGISLCFTLLLLFSGYIISGIWCGNFVHYWDTTAGTPYIRYGDQIDLSSFSGIWMITRYFITSTLVFFFFSAAVSAIYLFLSNYIYSFIAVMSLIIMDRMMSNFYEFSILHDHLSLNLDQWLVPESFETTVFLFTGGTLLLFSIIYVQMVKKDYSNGKIDENNVKKN